MNSVKNIHFSVFAPFCVRHFTSPYTHEVFARNPPFYLPLYPSWCRRPWPSLVYNIVIFLFRIRRNRFQINILDIFGNFWQNDVLFSNCFCSTFRHRNCIHIYHLHLYHIFKVNSYFEAFILLFCFVLMIFKWYVPNKNNHHQMALVKLSLNFEWKSKLRLNFVKLSRLSSLILSHTHRSDKNAFAKIHWNLKVWKLIYLIWRNEYV